MAGLPVVAAWRGGVAVALRAATLDDRERVRAWNGAPDVRARSLDPRPITPEAHARWFAERLASAYGHLWIIEHAGHPVGVVRIDRDTAGAPGRISIALDGAVRGRGIGRAALGQACRLDGGPVIAEILADNRPSLACFAAAGFTPFTPPSDAATDATRDLRVTYHQWRRSDDR